LICLPTFGNCYIDHVSSCKNWGSLKFKPETSCTLSKIIPQEHKPYLRRTIICFIDKGILLNYLVHLLLPFPPDGRIKEENIYNVVWSLICLSTFIVLGYLEVPKLVNPFQLPQSKRIWPSYVKNVSRTCAYVSHQDSSQSLHSKTFSAPPIPPNVTKFGQDLK